MLRSRILGIAALIASSTGLGGAESRFTQPEPRQPDPPRRRRERLYSDIPRDVRRRKEKLAKLARARQKKAGISGAGLWRKARAGGRVRGW